MTSLEHIGNIDPKLKMEDLKWCDEPNNKQISQPNSHRDEAEKSLV